MVPEKRLDYGFNGFQVPVTPRATRSARRRPTFQRRTTEDNQMCPFDLLATIAGNLLHENLPASSNSSSEKDQHGIVKEECQNVNKPLTDELSDEGSCDRRYFFGLSSGGAYDQNISLKESPHPENDGHSGIASIVTNSSSSERFVAETAVDGNSRNKMQMFDTKVDIGSSESAGVSGCKFDGDVNKVKVELHNTGTVSIGTGTETCKFGDPSEEKPPASISSISNTKLSGYDDNITRSPVSEGCTNIPVVSRDDDENFSGCTHPITKKKSFRPMTCIGDRRIRKISASRHWRVAPELMDDTLSESALDRKLKPIYHSRKNGYKRQLSQMNIPFKKRKLYDHRSVSNSEDGMNQDASGPRNREDPGLSSSEAHLHNAFQSRDSHVKLRIKSFRVPELFVEIPETATIGSLKRTVMEAVNTVLGGGIRVGVILKGKKIRDDNKTLLQTGISHNNQQDSLGFTLEPNSSQSITQVCAADSSRAKMPRPLKKYPSAAHHRIKGSSDDMLPEHQVTGLGNLVDSDHDSAPSPINKSPDKGTKDSKALVTVPEMDMEPLAVVPVHPKSSKRSEIVQRRIRRPFSVSEVEALVQAVEKLGTGRWRDVKLRAFETAKHRTYVDLKDKWKTLVHTARISPQQRRGEPVPQELLDRVLSAHAFWSQNQTKQQMKPHHSVPETCLLL